MDIQKILHTKPSIPKRKRGGSDKGVIHPVREWLVGLFFFFGVLVVGGTLSTYTFLQYTDIAVTETNASQTHTLYNQVLVQKALKVYQSRKNDFDRRSEREVIKVPVILEVASSTPVVSTQNNNTTTTSTKQSDTSAVGSELVN